MRNLLLLSGLLAMLTLSSCSGWQKLTVPSDPNYLYAIGLAESKDKQLAIDKAALIARTEIGRQMELELNSLQKRFVEEIGAKDDAELSIQYTSATKEVVSTQLMGSRIKESKYKEEGDKYHAEVLVEYPIGKANEALVNQIKKNKEMYTRFLASESFKELELEVEKMRSK